MVVGQWASTSKKILSLLRINEACVLMQRGLALNAQRQLNQ